MHSNILKHPSGQRCRLVCYEAAHVSAASRQWACCYWRGGSSSSLESQTPAFNSFQVRSSCCGVPLLYIGVMIKEMAPLAASICRWKFLERGQGCKLGMEGSHAGAAPLPLGRCIALCRLDFAVHLLPLRRVIVKPEECMLQCSHSRGPMPCRARGMLDQHHMPSKGQELRHS